MVSEGTLIFQLVFATQFFLFEINASSFLYAM